MNSQFMEEYLSNKRRMQKIEEQLSSINKYTNKEEYSNIKKELDFVSSLVINAESTVKNLYGDEEYFKFINIK